MGRGLDCDGEKALLVSSGRASLGCRCPGSWDPVTRKPGRFHPLGKAGQEARVPGPLGHCPRLCEPESTRPLAGLPLLTLGGGNGAWRHLDWGSYHGMARLMGPHRGTPILVRVWGGVCSPTLWSTPRGSPQAS